MTNIFSTFSGVIAVILVFGGLIFFHELGHFLVARLFSIGVKTFSLGFGKVLCKKKLGQTTYQISILPLGGYVALVGESPDAELPDGFTAKDSYSLRPTWQRLPVIAAGAIFNLLLALLIFWGMSYTHGRMEILPVIGKVVEASPAEASGILEGDKITEINGKAIQTWLDIPGAIGESGGEKLLLTFLRQGKSITAEITPKQQETTNAIGEPITRWIVGITAKGETRQVELGLGDAFIEGSLQAKSMIVLTWKVLVGLLRGSVPSDNLSGPIGITKVIYDESGKGIANILLVAAFISVNLGILNLLPIPVLDGGHIVFILLEMIFRRPVPLAVRERLSFVGMALLLSLMFYSTYNDISRSTAGSEQKDSSMKSTQDHEQRVENTLAIEGSNATKSEEKSGQ